MEQLLNGRYRIGPKIGDGGMAVVYRGFDTRAGRSVAIKVLREQYAADPQFLTRFEREARAVMGLSHPNIISISGVGVDGANHYIVMELIEGPNLKEVIRARGPLPVNDAIATLVQVLAGLGYAHERGIVHRDVKPQNILLPPNGAAKVTDFGIAKGLTDTALTESGLGIGTVHYISPEQARGEPVTPASDLYSVGVVLYELLTGTLPFTGDSAVGVAVKHAHDVPAPPIQLRPGIPAPLSVLTMRALEKDPQARFASAKEMTSALRGWRSWSPGQSPVRRSMGRIGASATRIAETVPAMVKPGGQGSAAPVEQGPTAAAGGRAATPAMHQAAGPAARQIRPLAPREAQPGAPRAAVAGAAPARPAAWTAPGRAADRGYGLATWLVGATVLLGLLGLVLVGYRLSPFGASGSGGAPQATPTAPAAAASPTRRSTLVALAPSPARGSTAAARAPASAPAGRPGSPTTPARATPTISPGPAAQAPPTVAPTATPARPAPTSPPAAPTAPPPTAVVAPAPTPTLPPAPTAPPRPATPTVAPPTVAPTATAPPRSATVPSVRGLSFEAAGAQLTGAGFTVTRVNQASATVAPGLVIEQSPAAGAAIAPGATVALIVSTGDQITLPNLVGLNYQEAQRLLTSAGFAVSSVNGQTRAQINAENPTFFADNPAVAVGQVISQSLPPGLYNRGTAVAIAYYSAP